MADDLSIAGGRMRRPNLEAVAESVWLRLLARVGVPLFITIIIPVTGWLGTQYLIGIQDKMQSQITLLTNQLSAINVDRELRREEQQAIVAKLSDTLNSISVTMGVIQATATSQYQESKGRLDDINRRMDRMEDRINSPVGPR